MTEPRTNLHDVAPVAGQVVDRISAQLGKRWGAGVRLPGVTRLAKELDIAPGTVVRALGELKQRGVLIARPRLGTYVSNNFTSAQLRSLNEAGTLATGGRALEGKRVELVYHSSEEPMVQKMVDAFVAEMQEAGAATIRSHQEKPTVIEPSDDQIHALAVFNPGRNTPVRCQKHQALLAISTPGHVNVQVSDGYDVVSVDQDQGGRMAADWLINRGCESALFVGMMQKTGGQPNSDAQASDFGPVAATRLAGFQSRWGDRPLRLYTTYAYGATAGARTARNYASMKPRPQGVFTASDELAMGFYLGALGTGLNIIDDYQLVGFDGQAIAQQITMNQMASVAAPFEEMGRRGAQLLISRLLNPDQATRRLALGLHLLNADARSVNS